MTRPKTSLAPFEVPGQAGPARPDRSGVPDVAALFVRADSIYKLMPGVDAWDIERDARAWPGGSPVVAHPPCRAWGALAWAPSGRRSARPSARPRRRISRPGWSSLRDAAHKPPPDQR